MGRLCGTDTSGGHAIAALPPAILSILGGASRSLARAWARPHYFASPDLASLPAKRIALLACHWIGDTFWVSQIVEPLTRRFPEASFYVLTKPHSVDLWHGLVPPERILTAPEVVSDRRREKVRWNAIQRRAAELEGEAFDLVLDLTGNRYSAFFTFRLRPEYAVGFGGGELSGLYSHCVADAERTGRHLSERPFRVIEPLLKGWAEPFAYRLPLRPPRAASPPDQVLTPLGLSGKRYVVVAPGAGWPEKEWGAASFAAAGQCLAQAGLAVAVTGAPRQQALCREVAEAVPGAVVSVDPIGSTVTLLEASQGVLANDSAIAHIGAALGRRTAAVFTGATDPRLYAPLGPAGAVRVFEADAQPAAIAEFLLSGR